MGKEADVRAFTESYSKSFNDAKLLKVAMFSKNIGNNVKLLPGKTVKNNKKKSWRAWRRFPHCLVTTVIFYNIA